MSQKKVISKGYTISVTSWENDGDNYNTQQITVDSLDMARAVSKMCTTLFLSENNGQGGIGNSCDLNSTIKYKISKFFKENPILINAEQHRELIEIEDEDEEEDFLVDICSDWAYQLLGNSEFYYCRVAESVSVTYSDRDIFLEEIKF